MRGLFSDSTEVSQAADIMTKPLLELICPAGSLLVLRAAADHGADGAPIHARPVPVPGFAPAANPARTGLRTRVVGKVPQDQELIRSQDRQLRLRKVRGIAREQIVGTRALSAEELDRVLEIRDVRVDRLV